MENNARTYWTIAAIVAFAVAAVSAFGGTTGFAGLWIAIGCMFLVFAFTPTGRS